HSDANVRTALVVALAQGAGAAGMVGGQMIDLSTAGSLDVDALTHLQNLKTGQLNAYSAAAGAILAGDATAQKSLFAYGLDLGLAFQITDDILDVEGSSGDLGKTPGKDAASGKATFVSRLGVGGAKTLANQTIERALGHLATFGTAANVLWQAAQFVLSRKS
ncbi:MAG: polyprenyl synthetase family protein, partial [Rhodospirillaceae bacterium]|nr:polyprenyl synthetase family protein [Rhodospirillaceae bacterium]